MFNGTIKNKNRTMNLITKTTIKKIPALYAQDGKGMKAIAHIKFFLGSFTWYGTEYEPETGTFFGKVFNGTEGELGYFNIEELAQLSIRNLVSVERDRYFKPTELSNVDPSTGN